MGEAASRRQPDRPVHGGDISAYRSAYAGDWLDLSTGINPFPYPLPLLPADVWARLPGSAEMVKLLSAARGAYGCPAEAGIVAVPGTQAAIQWLPRLFARGRVTVLGPTYAEHAHVWRQCGHDVTELNAVPGTLRDIDVLIAVNPNNPDGRAFGPDLLRRWHQELSERGSWLILDEAFADVVPEVSLAAEAGKPGLVILRSFGKFFGLAGLRLGFVLGDPVVTQALAQAVGPWAVSGPAAEIGAAALQDTSWQAAMREELRVRARRFDQDMRDRGIHVLGGTSLFRLAKVPDAAAFAARLRQQGIHTRIFTYSPDWMRFGLPPDEAAFWARFDTAMKDGG